MLKTKGKDGFIIEFWSGIFAILSTISIFSIVRKFKKNITYTFVEGWVVGNLIFAFISTLIGYYFGREIKWLMYFLLLYGMLRVFEVIIYQLNVLFFDAYRAEKKGIRYMIKSPTRMVILLLHNYVEVMLWYAVIIIALIQINGVSIDVTWGEFLRSNILCIATFNNSMIEKVVGTLYPKLSSIVFLQIISGLIMTLVSLARFIGIMPSIESID